MCLCIDCDYCSGETDGTGVIINGYGTPCLINSGCLSSTSESELNVNNVRTTILGGGDMWWNLDNAKYEIPKNSGRNSMFTGAIWVGGLDNQGNLKVAAMTYRQDGNDFWPGPLDTGEDYGTTNQETCLNFDQHWSIYKDEVIQYKAYLDCINNENCNQDEVYSGYTIPEVILNWPATTENQDGTIAYLAPFHDANDDGEYTVGIDYPEYNLNNELDCEDNALLGHQSIWWVFNDNGNIHTETGSESAIGLEIQAQAYAFATNDAINNMTFYDYKIINRSPSVLNEAYFGQWVDPDLGNYQDDYVGCDVGLGLGYCYNGDADDDGTAGYNYDSDDPPPAIGVDFFRGPLADAYDGIDNDRDGIIDESGEQIIMSKFVYYNNDFSDHGNPESATHYYGYLKGIWKDGQPMTYGGTGWESGNPECNFMFPDDTDPDFNDSWTEATAGNDPSDRRFLQSVGAFTLEPGGVKHITTGVVWARASEGDNLSSVALLKQHDQFVQELFDNCFDTDDYYCADLNNNDICDTDEITGCTNPVACNYNYAADIDDGSCEFCYYYGENYPFIAIFDNNQDLLSSSFNSNIIGCVSPGDSCLTLNSNNLLGSTEIENIFSIPEITQTSWINNIVDIDYDEWFSQPQLRPLDWVRSGTNSFSQSNNATAPYFYYGDISTDGTPINQSGYSVQQNPGDPNELYEFNGSPWLVPYKFVSNDYVGRATESTTANIVNAIDTIGGGLAFKDWKSECNLDSLKNVDIILTPDQNLWTRCPVIDMSEDELTWTASGPPMDNNQVASGSWPSGAGPGSNSYPWEITDGTGENGEEKWDLRLDPNVDKNGSPDGSGNGFNSANGWGWFPGYAINTNTGNRLNLMFSENSSLGEKYNANDMLFNPVSIDSTSINNGGHAVFILDTEYQSDNIEDNPHYDFYTGTSQNNAWNTIRKKYVIPHIMWVGYWSSESNQEWLANEVTIQARVTGDYDGKIMNENCECECTSDIDNDLICDEHDICVNDPENDIDGDGLCAENDPCPNNPDLSCTIGCTDENACNYNYFSTEDDGSCIYAEEYYNCGGTCINDTDGDGVCDENEISGCMTFYNACNYDPNATDEDGSVNSHLVYLAVWIH